MNQFSHRIRFFRRILAGLCLSAAFLCSTPASGQLDGASLAELGKPDYLHRDMVIFSQGLGLDDFQRMILDSLFEDYFDRFNAGWERTQDSLHNVARDVDNLDHSRVLEMVMEPFDEWRQEKQQLRERFEADVRAILNPEQAQQWTPFYQQMIREKTLPWGRLSGENVNLFHHLRNLNLDEQTHMDLEPVMDQYAAELHAALERRNALMTGLQAETIRSLRSYGRLPSGDSQQVQTRVQVRDVNMRYTDVIAERLPSPQADKFRTNVMEDVSTRVFRPLIAMRAITRASELEDIDDDTRAEILNIKATLESELLQRNQQLLAMVLDFEPKQMQNQADMAAARQRGERVDRIEDPTRQAFAERNERAQQYVEMVHALLTPEQIRELPRTQRANVDRVPDPRRAIGVRDEADDDPRGGARPSRTGDAPARRGMPTRGSGRGGR